MNNSNKETILIKNIKQLKHMMKDRTYNNYELVEPIMIKGVKCFKPRTKPKQKPKTLKQLMLEGFERQEKFNKQIINRLDNVDKRLDKHDQMFEMVLDQFKNHQWIK